MTTNEDEILRHVTPEAMHLFNEMAEVHERSSSGDRVFISVPTMAGTVLIFSSPTGRKDWQDVDLGALKDLSRAGLLEEDFNGSGDPIYRLTGIGINFYRNHAGQGDIEMFALTPYERQSLEPLLSEVRSFIEAMEASGEADPNDVADVQAQADTLQAQMKAARPSRRVIAAAGKVLREIGLLAIGGALGARLGEIAGRILEAIGN